MRPFRLLCLCLGLWGCPNKASSVDSAVRSCRRSEAAKKSNIDCDCLVHAVVDDMSPEEVQLWVNDPNLFDEDEVGVLVLREAVQCLQPQIVAACVKGGGNPSTCACVAEGYLGAFSGQQLEDLMERMGNGAAIPPEASRIRTDCLTKSRQARPF